jgi:signal transduction histidine kinase
MLGTIGASSRRDKGRSIRALVITAALLAAVLPVVTMGGLAYVRAAAPMQDTIADELALVARGAIDAVDSAYDDRTREMRLWSSLGIMQEVVIEDADAHIARFLRRVIETHRSYVHVAVYGTSGRLVAATDAAAPPELAQPDDAVAERYSISVPIYSDADRHARIGTLQGRLQPDFYANVLLRFTRKGDASGAAFLIDSAGNTIAAVTHAGEPSPPPQYPALAWQGGVGSGWMVDPSSGEPVGFARGGPKNADWSVILRAPIGITFAKVTRFKNYVLIGSVLFAVTLSILGVLLADRIARPIEALTGAVERIRQSNDLTLRVREDGVSETRKLGLEFNGLVQELSVARQHIEHHAEELENQVKVRTVALEKQSQELLGAYRQAQQAVAARDDIMAIVSHDLRNPLNAVLLGATGIQRRSQDPAALHFAAMIQESGQRMNALIRDVLDATSIEHHGLTIHCHPEEPASILQAIQVMFAPAAEEKGVRLLVAAAGPLSPIECDADRVVQALSNLVGNALKFTPPGAAVSVTAHETATATEFEVTDAGPGIPPEDRHHLFERYWKGSSGKQGTGLGLYIAQGIARSHGGQVSVATAPGGQGCTFSMRIPRTAAKPEVPQPIDEPASRPNKISIA